MRVYVKSKPGEAPGGTCQQLHAPGLWAQQKQDVGATLQTVHAFTTSLLTACDEMFRTRGQHNMTSRLVKDVHNILPWVGDAATSLASKVKSADKETYVTEAAVNKCVDDVRDAGAAIVELCLCLGATAIDDIPFCARRALTKLDVFRELATLAFTTRGIFAVVKRHTAETKCFAAEDRR